MKKFLSAYFVWGVVAAIFGLMTIKEGASVLFFNGQAREAAGNYVPFVLIFNFIAGFFYISAGLGLILKKKWAIYLAGGIGVLTALVFVGLGHHIQSGGLYELRTVIAMTIRTLFWIATYVFFHSRKNNKLNEERA